MQTKIIAKYRTTGGHIIAIESERDFPGDYPIYTWTCPGCRTEKPLTAETEQKAKQTADAHAKDCRAI
ncbi:hypothetical protein [Kitasatospora sp. NPDC127116]|uniref:hypothetical protein n=1 Tax=Kitasatospora sp. NPDC127116 TaxID=3345367 RepID=UPI00362E3D79